MTLLLCVSRAVALGLTADEIQNVENYMEELKAKRANEDVRNEKERDVLKVKVRRTRYIRIHLSIKSCLVNCKRRIK